MISFALEMFVGDRRHENSNEQGLRHLAAQCEIPPHRAIPFRDSIAEGGIAPICLLFRGYRASIAEIPLGGGGYRTSTSHALQGGNAQKRGRGYRTHFKVLAMLRHQNPIARRLGGIAEIVSRYRAIRGH